MKRGLRKLARGCGCAAVLAAALTLAASPARASDAIGESYGSSGGLPCTNDATYVQSDSAGNRYAAPYDGVITSWTTGGFWTTATFKVARLGGGNTYTVIGQDGPRTTAYNVEATYDTRIPVRQGDVIGAYVPSSSYCAYTGQSGDVVGRTAGDVAPGPGSFDDSDTRHVPIAATIERDRDGDGYGDETQDGCPSVASTHGPCPLPTVLGRTFTPALDGGCADFTVLGIGPADYPFAAPADGVVTSWSFEAGGVSAGTTLKLKTMRPQGGFQYLTVAEDGPRTPAANQLNTFPARVPMRSGDRIGLSVTGPAKCVAYNGSGSSLEIAGDPAVGSSNTLPISSNRALDLSAVLEADADGDGYGDSSQDQCPTDASTQGACPVAQPPPPGDDPACEKAKKKLKKAKAKLKKLKQKDAAAKQVKSAKGKVKKAKKRVKKAC